MAIRYSLSGRWKSVGLSFLAIGIAVWVGQKASAASSIEAIALVIPVIVALALLAVQYSVLYFLRERRSRKLRRVAESLGFRFELSDEGSTELPPKTFPLISTKVGQARNIFEGECNGAKLLVFDLWSGTNWIRANNQTVAYFPETIPALPTFQLDGPITYLWVPKDLRKILQGKERFCAEAHAGALLLFRTTWLVQPKSYAEFIATATETRAALKAALERAVG